jgi:hypothetical protein
MPTNVIPAMTISGEVAKAIIPLIKVGAIIKNNYVAEVKDLIVTEVPGGTLQNPMTDTEIKLRVLYHKPPQ